MYQPAKDWGRVVGTLLEKGVRVDILGEAAPGEVKLNPGAAGEILVNRQNEYRFERAVGWACSAADHMIEELKRCDIFPVSPLALKGSGPHKNFNGATVFGGCDLGVRVPGEKKQNIDLRVAISATDESGHLNQRHFYTGLVEMKFSEESIEKALANAETCYPKLKAAADNGVFTFGNNLRARAACVGALAVTPRAWLLRIHTAEKQNWKPPASLARAITREFPQELQQQYPHASALEQLTQTLKTKWTEATGAAVAAEKAAPEKGAAEGAGSKAAAKAPTPPPGAAKAAAKTAGPPVRAAATGCFFSHTFSLASIGADPAENVPLEFFKAALQHEFPPAFPARVAAALAI